MNLIEIKERYDYDKLDGDFYEAVYCGDPIQRVEDLRCLIVEVDRYKNIVKSKSPRKWEITNWIDRCNKAEAEVEQLNNRSLDMQAGWVTKYQKDEADKAKLTDFISEVSISADRAWLRKKAEKLLDEF